jgi:formamidopyrimidine-DNA glycosylase
MPELPEVEHGARVLRAASTGRTIAAITTRHPVYSRSLPAADATRATGHAIADVARLEFHFGMTGEWAVGRTTDPAVPFGRVVIDFHDGSSITLADPRCLGAARYHAPGTPILPDLGPEPLSREFSADTLGASLAKRRGPIKVALLDQSLVAGLGNIYAAEALWLAKIDPRTPAASLGPARRTRLVQAIRHVLRRAPAERYTDRENGARQWRAYDREGNPCRRCGTPIKRIVQATRSTFYCPHCQRR